MTLLFITRKFPPSTGGMENFARDLYESLRKGRDVRLVKWGGSNRYLPVVVPYLFFRACWFLARGGIDIVHVQDGLLAPLGYVLSRMFRKPFTIVLHGLDVTYRSRLYQMIIPKLVAKADIVFCISQATADEAIKRGVAAAKTRVIPLGMTDEYHAAHQDAHIALRKELGLADDARVLLTVGRLVERKGVAWFIGTVMPQLSREQPSSIYVVVGSGSEEAAIKEMIANHQLQKHVTVLGEVAESRLRTLYNGADVFVQPNIVVPGDMEGFGRVLLEASLCELPVVAAGVEGIRDAIIDGENGVLVASGDAQAFIANIGTFLTDRERAYAFGARSRTYTLAHFQWRTIARQYVAAYSALIHLKPPL